MSIAHAHRAAGLGDLGDSVTGCGDPAFSTEAGLPLVHVGYGRGVPREPNSLPDPNSLERARS